MGSSDSKAKFTGMVAALQDHPVPATQIAFWRELWSMPESAEDVHEAIGPDIVRKLLDKQKEGKKRMRQFGAVEIPQSAFIEALKIGDE